MAMFINSQVAINRNIVARDGASLTTAMHAGVLTPEKLYELLQCNYPKFFKMDKLCKWAIAGTEYLFAGNDLFYKNIDKNKVAVILSTSHGCIDVDKRYYDGIAVPSPALFVYTLPNIMLGEICIRYGFKGEQLCMINEIFDAGELYFTIHDQLTNRGMEACLCGWVDTNEDDHEVCLFWVSKNGIGANLTAASLQKLYSQH